MHIIIFGGENMNYTIIPNWIAFIVLVIGGLNWGLVGILNFNLVEWIFGGFNVGAIIIYVLVLISALWLIISAFLNGAIYFRTRQER